MILADTPPLRSGKVRDIYEYDENHLLFRTSRRISAFDVILPDEIPGKGRILNKLTKFWMEKFKVLIPNQLTDIEPPHYEDVGPGELMVVKKLDPLPVEAIVRGYIIGSGWKDYKATGRICGNWLPHNLRLADKLPEPIFTPSTKAEVGDHDMNITYEEMIDVLRDPDLASRVRTLSMWIYREAREYALNRGIIIADTKLEFGLDENGVLHLIDEVLTPDSSRFWPLDEWTPGENPPSYDKQIVRDYLETLTWDKTSPGPHLPLEIIERTANRYREVYKKLTATE